MNQFDNDLYTGSPHSTGSRDGTFNGSADRSLQNSASTRTDPRQRPAIGWSTSFLGAMDRAARVLNVALPAGATDEVEIGLCVRGGEVFLLGRHNVSLPGLKSEIAWSLIDAAHRISDAQAVRRNIIVEINLV